MFPVLLLSIFSFFYQNPSAWIEYIADDAKFSILAPGEFNKMEKLIEMETGDLLITNLNLVSDVDSTDNFLYLVNYYPIEAILYDLDSMENNYSYLKLLVGDIAKNFSSTILYTTESYVSSFPAIEYRLDFEEKDQQIKGKIILNHSYLVSLQVFTHKQMALNKNMDYFLQSFHFKDSY